MDQVTGIAWPGSGHRLLLDMVQDYFGGSLRYITRQPQDEAADANATSPNAVSTTAGAVFVLEDGETSNLPQIAGRKYLIQHRDFTSWVISAYDRALKKDAGLTDSSVAFANFVSQQFTAYRMFMDRWVHSDFAKNQLLLSYEQLIVYPLDSLRLAVWWFDTERPINEEQLATAVQRANIRDDQDPVAFRHYNAALFSQISKLCLTREDVRKSCLDLLGREPSEKSIIPFQCFPSVDAMEEALRASTEYQMRQTELSRKGEA